MRRVLRLRSWWRLLAVLSALPLLPCSAHTQEAALEPTTWPLSSIGRVNVITGAGRRMHCTGTLVGARHVLTAAHCLFNKDRGTWVHPSSVHFVAGYARGEYKAHSEAASYERGPGFVFTHPPQPRAASQDWAVIELAQAIDLKPIGVRLGGETFVGSPPIVRAGYRADRAHVLTVQRDCFVQPVSAPVPLLLHSCGSVPGESGSALLQLGGGEAQIIGIVVAGSKQEGAAPSVAVPASAFAGAIVKALKQ